jgi:hypothetical protein
MKRKWKNMNLHRPACPFSTSLPHISSTNPTGVSFWSWTRHLLFPFFPLLALPSAIPPSAMSVPSPAAVTSAPFDTSIDCVPVIGGVDVNSVWNSMFVAYKKKEKKSMTIDSNGGTSLNCRWQIVRIFVQTPDISLLGRCINRRFECGMT